VIVNESVMSILNVQEILNLSGMGDYEAAGYAQSPDDINGALSMNRMDS
jgi:hypothetical protein